MKLPILALFASGVSGLNAHDNERQAYVDKINAIPGILWKAGINRRFQGLPLNATRELCGVKKHSQEIMDKAVNEGRAHRHVYSGAALPDSFDSETNWPECAEVIGDIRDQSMCGCCWAFGAAGAASDRLCIASKGALKVPLSAQDICFCASDDGCNGGDLFTPWSYIKTSGIVTGGQFNGTGPFGSGMCSDFTLPHCHHHGPQGEDPYPAEGTPGCPSQKSQQCPTACDKSAIFPHNNFANDKYTFDGLITTFTDVESIKETIMTDGPVEAAFLVYADFANYVSGIYHKTSDKVEGGHAIRIVGWGSEGGQAYWKVANSWNPYWGEEGYFRILAGVNECNIESSPTATFHGSTWSKKTTN